MPSSTPQPSTWSSTMNAAMPTSDRGSDPVPTVVTGTRVAESMESR